jgi:hypothetical protein
MGEPRGGPTSAFNLPCRTARHAPRPPVYTVPRAAVAAECGQYSETFAAPPGFSCTCLLRAAAQVASSRAGACTRSSKEAPGSSTIG